MFERLAPKLWKAFGASCSMSVNHGFSALYRKIRSLLLGTEVQPMAKSKRHDGMITDADLIVTATKCSIVHATN